MEFENPDQICLRGSLILADPSLNDPNFCRTVLLLTEHSTEEGAHGYVLNRPLEKKVSDILKSDEFETLADIPVFAGGPVSTEQLTFASFHWNEERGELDFETHLSTEQARQRVAEGFAVRAFVGYSGWTGGQLESELQQRAWITRKPSAEVLETGTHETLWGSLLKAMGPWYRILAGTPDDPSLN